MARVKDPDGNQVIIAGRRLGARVWPLRAPIVERNSQGIGFFPISLMMLLTCAIRLR
jgi:hypothetical protein